MTVVFGPNFSLGASGRRHRNGRGGRGAFTLIEMLLVIVLIGVLAGAMAVSLSGRQDGVALEVSARDLAEALRFAAGEARLRGRPYRVTFLEDSTAYLVEEYDAEGVKYTPTEGRAGVRQSLAAGVQVSDVLPPMDPGDAAGPGVTFDPAGGWFTGRITLKNRAGKEMWVEALARGGPINVGP